MPSPFNPDVSVQTAYTYGRGRAMPGERPRANIYMDRPCERCVFPQDDVSQVDTITFLTTAAGNPVSINIDGASIPFVAAATLTLTAAAAETALDAAAAQGIFYGVIDPTVTDANVAVLTLGFMDAGLHTVTFTPGVGTTASVASPSTIPGTVAVKAKAGTVAVYNTTQGDPTLLKCAEPSAANTRPVGVISRGPYNAGTTPPGAFGLFAGESWPVKVMVSCWQKADVEVLIASDVTAGGQCYFIATGPGTPNNGYFVGSDGATAGTGQVSQLTITPAVAGTVSVTFNGFAPTEAFASSNVLATDNVSLRNAINTHPQLIDAMSIPAAVNAGKVIVTFKPTAAATSFTDASAGGPTVAHAITTPNVAPGAATAAIYPGATFVETRTADQLQATVDLG